MTEYTFVQNAGFLLSLVVYGVLLLVMIVLALLYHKAYVKMKRSPVIGSLLCVMIAVCFDTIYYGAVTFMAGTELSYQVLVGNPYFIMVPKIFLIGAFGYFLYTSLSPNPPIKNNTECVEKASDIVTMRKNKCKKVK